MIVWRPRARSAILACRPLVGPVRRAVAARPTYVATQPWGCHRRRIGDRIVFDKLIQVLRFGCSYEAIADTTCSATTLRTRRDEWIELGVFGALARIARQAYDRIVGLVLDEIAVDGCITKAPGGGEVAGPSPVDRRKQGMKRSVLVEGYGIPLGRVRAGAQRHDSPLLAPTLDLLDDLGPLPGEITVHLDAGYDSGLDLRHPRRSWAVWQDRPQGREGTDPGRPALARRAHQRLAQYVQPAPTLLRTPREGYRRVLRPRRRDHHRA